MERFFIFMPLAQKDLSRCSWADSPWPVKMLWMRELLEGLSQLHGFGIMHRDIRLQNMLIISAEPPRASICDYGKAIEAANSADTCIGPVHTLAPEVWTVSTTGRYTAKIDMWAFGYAIAEWLVHFSKHNGPDRNPLISRARHSMILEMLQAHGRKTPEDAPLVSLIDQLLIWDPEQRWSAEQALQHHCWDAIRQAEEDSVNAEPCQRKRKKQDSHVISMTDHASTLNTPDTVEVSQGAREKFVREWREN